jgi:hypothetical protein
MVSVIDRNYVMRCVRYQVLTAAIITLMMEADSTCETSVNFYQATRRNNSEDSHLHTRRRENIKSHFG